MRRIARSHLPPDLYGRLRMRWWWLRAHLPVGAPITVPGIPGRVHRQDNMVLGFSTEQLRRYDEIGRSAMANIETGLRTSGRTTPPRQVLDFPSGYGRVLRHMMVAWPRAHFTAADLDPRGVRFCAAEFHAMPLVSQVDFTRIVFADRYDLIWVGSLVTHLTADRGMQLLDVLAGVLERGGVLIFTTQCDLSEQRLLSYGRTTAGQVDHVRTTTLTQGHCYNPSDRMAFHTPEWILSSMAAHCPSLRLTQHAPRGWDDHQDVWTYQSPPG